MWQLITAGMILGMTSSAHCVGMCGPLAMALPTSHLSRFQQRFAVILYHLGRVSTYSLIGFLLGISARGIYVAGFQRWISITSGALILLYALYGIVMKKQFLQSRMPPFFQTKLVGAMTGLLKSPTSSSYFFLGACNGLLPCGMVYLALAAALGFSQTLESVLFMASFGVGTLPAMLALSFFGMKIKGETRMLLKNVVPYLVMVVGILLIFRGLNLGIPFLSPSLMPASQPVFSCH